MFGKSFSKFSFRKAFFGIALGGIILMGSASAASAAGGPICDRRIAHERLELNRSVARYGFYSGPAIQERRELARLRFECGYRDRWR